MVFLWFFTGLPTYFFAFARGMIFALARGTAMPLINEKKRVFFPFARGTVLLPREARFCFHERHGCASWKRKKEFLFLFFRFIERHRRTSRKQKNVFSVIFFLQREAQLCLCERY